MNNRLRNTLGHTRHAFGLIEAALSITLVGGLLIASLDLLGAAAAGHNSNGDRGVAHLLALDLMTEILQQDYMEPDGGVSFGRDSSENGGSRQNYDDVDDYDNWTCVPPETKDGTAMTQFAQWQRKVDIVYVDPNDIGTVMASDTGVKRITVDVKKNGALLVSLVAVRTNAKEAGAG